MRTFSVEGISNASMESAMADAMGKANGMAQGAGRLDIAVASAVKDKAGIFHVTVSVIAKDIGEEPDPAERQEGGDEAGSRGHDNAHHRRRAEEVSQQLKDEMIERFHVQTHMPSMDEALEQGEHFVETATPDTTAYTAESMADHERRETDLGLAPQEDRDESPIFDVVQEAGEEIASNAVAPDNNRVTTVMAREVDEVIGLLSMGFYDPPRPHDAPAREVEITGQEAVPTPHDALIRERRENGLPDDPALQAPILPAEEPQPAPDR